MNDLAIRILSAQPGKTHLFSVGQAGFVLKSRSGQTLAWDLYLSECGERLEGHAGFKRLLPKLLYPEELVFDLVVASHFHFDHFDPDSIPALLSNGHTKLLAAADCAGLVKDLHLEQCSISYVRPGDVIQSGDFSIRFVNCDHGTLAPEAVGAVITVDGKKVFFAGDTCLRLDRAEEILSTGEVDIMIAPINGAYGNLNEEDCARLSKAIYPRLTIPCHYGMFASHGGDLGVFRRFMKEECPENAYLLMRMGEQFIIPEVFSHEAV